MDVLNSCYIESAKITTAPKVFINYPSFLSWIELFDKSVPDSVARPLVLVYDGCCSHYNDKNIKNC